jgi:hypothetical protein
MLTTTSTRNFELEITDSTFVFLPGTARIGNTLMSWNGTVGQLGTIPLFAGAPDANKFQNCLLYLYNSNGMTDMTVARSDTTSLIQNLSLPSMQDSSGYPLTMMTFFSATGSDSTLWAHTPI